MILNGNISDLVNGASLMVMNWVHYWVGGVYIVINQSVSMNP